MVGTPIRLVSDPDEVVDTLHPLRRRILDLLDTPDSATGLAARLDTSRQRVNYHLRKLEDAGMVELAEVRQRRGLQERVMRRRNEIVLIDPTAFSAGVMSRQDAAGITAVVAMASDQIRRAALVATAAAESGSRVVAATLDTSVRVPSPAALKSLLDEIGAVIAHHDSGEEGLLVHIGTSVLPEVAAP